MRGVARGVLGGLWLAILLEAIFILFRFITTHKGNINRGTGTGIPKIEQKSEVGELREQLERKRIKRPQGIKFLFANKNI